MSAMRGGSSGADSAMRALAAAVQSAAQRLERLGDATERATRATSDHGESARRGGDVLLSMARMMTGGAVGGVIAAGSGAAARGSQDIGGAMETAMMRVLARLPGAGAGIKQALNARDATESQLMSIYGPIAAAGGRVDPEQLTAHARMVGIRNVRTAHFATELSDVLNRPGMANLLDSADPTGATAGWRWAGRPLRKLGEGYHDFWDKVFKPDFK